ncbi:MAG: sigma-70 family RNA polymerase sigma factor [Bdellovibrio sp.]|nr:MAG: sigma-70 family RNA polymerase sigma factor [Bdellovibrio sp.]
MMNNEKDLIERVKLGHTASFSKLVRKHQKSLLRLAMRITNDLQSAEDIVQESFIKAFKKLDSFEGRSSFKSWMYRIVINTAKNKLRKHKKDHLDIAKVQISTSPIAENSLSFHVFKEVLQKEIQKLPPRQKMALILRVFEELSFKEIADIMACPYDTAKANYRHALMKLRHQFNERKELKTWEDFDQNFNVSQLTFMEN